MTLNILGAVENDKTKFQYPLYVLKITDNVPNRKIISLKSKSLRVYFIKRLIPYRGLQVGDMCVD